MFDCGIFEYTHPVAEINTANRQVISHILESPPKYIFLSHGHYDHTRGLRALLKSAKIADYIQGIFCTKSTALQILDELFKKKKYLNQRDQFLSKVIIVEKDEKINLTPKDWIRCVPSGHVVGAVAFWVHFTLPSKKEWNAFYTGDYCLDDLYGMQHLGNYWAKLPKKMDLGIIDASRKDRDIPSLEAQLSALWDEAQMIWEQGGSVVIATDLRFYSLLVYLYFFDKLHGSELQCPIYIAAEIRKVIERAMLAPSDFPPMIKSQINNHRSPFFSWRVQILDSIKQTYQALASPSLIITHPNQIGTPPLSEIFPLVAMDESSMLAFALYLNRNNDDTTWDFAHEDPLEISHKSKLNGILSVPVEMRFQPKCHVFNRMEKYKYFTFQNHANQAQFRELTTQIRFQKIAFLHQSALECMKNIDF